MKASIILAHPNLESFNHAIAKAAAEALVSQGWQVHLHDLYAEGFDPLLPEAELRRDCELPAEIRQHCDEIVSADGIVIVHPNWWGQPPAILKGWQDRVLRMGIAYKFQVNEKGEGVPVGLLKARWGCVFTTSNTPAEAEKRMFGDPLENLWTRCILEFCGAKAVQRKNYEVIITSTPEQRAGWLKETGQIITSSLSMSR
jgi:NAD(P)H dehydrogenase (quinone)